MIEDPELLEKAGNFVNGVIYTYRSYDPESKNELVSHFVAKFKENIILRLISMLVRIMMLQG